MNQEPYQAPYSPGTDSPQDRYYAQPNADMEAPQSNSTAKVVFWLLVLALVAALCVLGASLLSKWTGSFLQRLGETSYNVQNAANSVVDAVNQTVGTMGDVPGYEEEPAHDTQEEGQDTETDAQNLLPWQVLQQVQQQQEQQESREQQGQQEPQEQQGPQEQQEPQEPSVVPGGILFSVSGQDINFQDTRQTFEDDKEAGTQALLAHIDTTQDVWHQALEAHDLLIGNASAYGMSDVQLSDSYLALLEALGIPCERIEGTYNNRAMTWCSVQIDGAYYYIDIAGDRELVAQSVPGSSEASHAYFCISYEEMQNSGHVFTNEEYQALPATSLAANYYEHEGFSFKAYQEEDLRNLFISQAAQASGSNGAYVFEVKYRNGLAFADALAALGEANAASALLEEATGIYFSQVTVNSIPGLQIILLSGIA